MRSLVILLISILFPFSLAFSFSTSPLAYVERVGGSDVINATGGAILVVLENPSNSGEPKNWYSLKYGKTS